MISLSLLLAAIAIADILCGEDADDRHLGVRVSFVVIPSVGAAATYSALGAPLCDGMKLGLLALACTAGWQGLRRAGRHGAALASLAIGVGVGVVGDALLGTQASLAFIEPGLAELPWFEASDARPGVDFYLLTASIMLFLTRSGNSVVRSVLLMASDEPALLRSESKLRGGRFIGVLERYLIFGMALAGEPTAAALVISAKSIIRFPELSSRGRAAETTGAGDVDEITEYFLLGSLTSWTLALAPTVLLIAIKG